MNLKNNLLKLLLLLGLPVLALAQTNTLTTTTLSAAIAQPSGSTPPTQIITVASATGINAPSVFNGTAGSMLYVDREAMQVVSILGTAITVQRGQRGTKAVGHVSGAYVWIGNPQWFQVSDPLGTCSVGAQYASPWVNAITGGIWLCSGSTYVITNQVVFLPPSVCWDTAATTAFTAGPVLVRAATGNQVMSATTNTTAGTVTVDCSLAGLQTGFAPSPGSTLQAVSLLYGVQTTALSSIATAIVDGVTYPVSTSGGAAAAGTVAALSTGNTVTPGTLQLATTTAGQCYNEKVTLGTPFVYNTDVFQPTFEQVFTTAGTSATTIQVCGLILYFGDNPAEISPEP